VGVGSDRHLIESMVEKYSRDQNIMIRMRNWW